MIRVLIADDQPVIREGLRTLLAAVADDIEVVGAAATGREAVAAARALRPDVVLLDVRMPVMDGIDAASTLSTECGVLMLTYSDERETVVACIQAGARGYLVHGRFEPADLVRAVHEVAEGGNVLAPAVAPVVFDAVRHPDGGTSLRGHEPHPLTAREREIMQLITRGRTNRAIASELYISEKTVKNHARAIYGKLGAASRGEATAIWLGLADAPGDLGPAAGR